MKLNSLQELEVLSNNAPEYKGRLPKYQQVGYTQYQDLLYKRAIFGLSVYSKEEVNKMHWEKKKRIKRVNKRAQSCINILKQERVNEVCDAIYNRLFPKSKLAKKVLSLQIVDTDPTFINNLELKSLGITKQLIIDKLIDEKILPSDFYNLKEAV